MHKREWQINVLTFILIRVRKLYVVLHNVLYVDLFCCFAIWITIVTENFKKSLKKLFLIHTNIFARTFK